MCSCISTRPRLAGVQRPSQRLDLAHAAETILAPWPSTPAGSNAAPDGIARYTDRPRVARGDAARDASSARRTREAIVELGGTALTYRAAVGPRGARRRAACTRPGVGARRPRRDPAGQRRRLGARVLGRAAAGRRRRAGQHALRRGRGRSYVLEDSGAALRLRGRRAAARRRAVRRRRRRARRPGGDLLHERHDRLPEGRDAHARELPGQQRDRAPRASALPREVDAAHARLGPAVPRDRLQQPAARRAASSAGRR